MRRYVDAIAEDPPEQRPYSRNRHFERNCCRSPVLSHHCMASLVTLVKIHAKMLYLKAQQTWIYDLSDRHGVVDDAPFDVSGPAVCFYVIPEG